MNIVTIGTIIDFFIKLPKPKINIIVIPTYVIQVENKLRKTKRQTTAYTTHYRKPKTEQQELNLKLWLISCAQEILAELSYTDFGSFVNLLVVVVLCIYQMSLCLFNGSYSLFLSCTFTQPVYLKRKV